MALRTRKQSYPYFAVDINHRMRFPDAGYQPSAGRYRATDVSGSRFNAPRTAANGSWALSPSARTTENAQTPFTTYSGGSSTATGIVPALMTAPSFPCCVGSSIPFLVLSVVDVNCEMRMPENSRASPGRPAAAWPTCPPRPLDAAAPRPTPSPGLRRRRRRCDELLQRRFDDRSAFGRCRQSSSQHPHAHERRRPRGSTRRAPSTRRP